MNAKDAIRQSIEMTDMLTGKYLEDLDDSAFFLRPIAGMNHIAWQVGHLISTERRAVESIKPGSCPPLPEGFDDKHVMGVGHVDDPKQFFTKDEYLGFWKAQRAATMAVLNSMEDADLDAPAPEKLRGMAPTVGHALNLMGGIHPMMHAGQYVAVRRAMDKPIAM